jgi:hypothetical protein
MIENLSNCDLRASEEVHEISEAINCRHGMNKTEEAISIMNEKRRARLAFRCQKKLFNSIKEEASKRKLAVSALIVEVLSERLMSPSFESVRQDHFFGHPHDLLDDVLLLLAQLPPKRKG